MAGLQPRCCNVSMASVLQHTCLFTARPCVQYRLNHHRKLVARQRCKVITSAVNRAWGDCESDASNTHSRRPNVHSGRQGHAECTSSSTKGSLVDRILLALRQIGLAALAVLFGLSTAMSAHARYTVITSVTKYCTNCNPKGILRDHVCHCLQHTSTARPSCDDNATRSCAAWRDSVCRSWSVSSCRWSMVS